MYVVEVRNTKGKLIQLVGPNETVFSKAVDTCDALTAFFQKEKLPYSALAIEGRV